MTRLTLLKNQCTNVSVAASLLSSLFVVFASGCATQQPYPYNCVPYNQGYAANPYAPAYNAVPYPQQGVMPITPAPQVGAPIPGQYQVPAPNMYAQPQSNIPAPFVGQ